MSDFHDCNIAELGARFWGSFEGKSLLQLTCEGQAAHMQRSSGSPEPGGYFHDFVVLQSMRSYLFLKVSTNSSYRLC